MNELKNQIAELNEKTKLIHKTFNKEILVKSAAAITIYSNLNNRSEQIQKQSEQVTNRTQKLLDNANNGLENLNKINKSISGEIYNTFFFIIISYLINCNCNRFINV